MADPLTVSSTFSSYTTYQVTSTIFPEGVRRRYSDFDWLRDVLVSRYHGVAVPLMPEKRLVGNQSRGFIEERMQGLEQFMLLVLSNPYLRLDATLRMFLTQKGTAEFEQAKKAAAGGVGADPSSNPGLARWFGVLRAIALPADAEEAMKDLTASIDDQEARVVNALSAVTRYWESAKAVADSLRSMRDAFGDWSTACNTSASAFGPTLGAMKDHTLVLSTKLKKSGDAFANAYDLAVFSPNEVQIFLLDALVTEVHRLRSLRSLISVREAAQQAYSRAWIEQDKLQFQAKQFRDKLREDKASQLEPKIAEAVGMMKRLKERVDDISKGTLFIEADKNSRARTARIIAMAGQYAALCIASGVRTQELWSSFLTSMELDQNVCVTDAQATLTGQTSMHGMDAVSGAPIALPIPTSTLAGKSFAVAASPARAAAPSTVPAASGGALFSGSSAPPASTGGALFAGSSDASAPAPAPAPEASSGGGIFGDSSVDL
jgi:hypothetical protein